MACSAILDLVAFAHTSVTDNISRIAGDAPWHSHYIRCTSDLTTIVPYDITKEMATRTDDSRVSKKKNDMANPGAPCCHFLLVH
jgi:hypothetical protein